MRVTKCWHEEKERGRRQKPGGRRALSKVKEEEGNGCTEMREAKSVGEGGS